MSPPDGGGPGGSGKECPQQVIGDSSAVTPTDLYAVGKDGGPPYPRPGDLKFGADDQICPNATYGNGTFYGLSTFASPHDLAEEVTGQVWMLPAGTNLSGLAVIADGQNYGGPLPSSHHTIYPTEFFAYDPLREKFLGLGWVHVGHTRDF